MKVRGDNAPLNTFSTEEQPKNPGYSLIRFYENSTPYSSEERGIAVSGYEYDEYHLEVEDRDDLKAYIQNHFDELLAKAKLAEADFRTPQEKRKWAYENELSIIYRDEAITVDAANKQFMEYTAEGAVEKCQELQQLIAAAKDTIRNTYPDEMEV